MLVCSLGLVAIAAAQLALTVSAEATYRVVSAGLLLSAWIAATALLATNYVRLATGGPLR